MLFGNATLRKRLHTFKILGEKITVADNINCLGFYLDSKFNWLDHLDLIRSKVKCYTLTVRRVSVRDRGLDKEILKI